MIIFSRRSHHQKPGSLTKVKQQQLKIHENHFNLIEITKRNRIHRRFTAQNGAKIMKVFERLTRKRFAPSNGISRTFTQTAEKLLWLI